MSFLANLFHKYMIVRRALVLWAAGLITYTVFKFFELANTVDTPTASVIIAIIGILSVATAFYPGVKNDRPPNS